MGQLDNLQQGSKDYENLLAFRFAKQTNTAERSHLYHMIMNLDIKSTQKLFVLNSYNWSTIFSY